MNDRIDYVRVMNREEGSALYLWKERLTSVMQEYCHTRKMEVRQVCDFNNHYDNSQRRWIVAFDVWGEAADYFFNQIAFSDRPNVTRVDYRIEIERLGVRMATIAHVVKVNKGRTRRTITQIDSPPRTKKGDRDAGGDFFAVGSKGSARRVALYKRGDEPHALEVQFAKGLPEQIHQRAVDLYLNKEGYTYQSAYMAIAREMFSEAVRDMLHYSVEHITGQTPVEEKQEVLNFQESLLENFDEYWEKLDDTARAVLREKVVAEPKKYDTIRYEESEPADLWDGIGYTWE